MAPLEKKTKKSKRSHRPPADAAAGAGRTPPIRVRDLRRDDWPVIERLFGEKGACGGCWCMWWRVPRGGKLWEDSKGAKNKRTFKRLLSAGKVLGCLAFVDDEPVGWCCVGPRSDFPRLERTKALKTDWDKRTWSVTCFYIKAGFRGKGVASALLPKAVALAKRKGARVVEGYPVRPKTDKSIPAAFAWTGIPGLFERCGFGNVATPNGSRDIYQLNITR